MKSISFRKKISFLIFSLGSLIATSLGVKQAEALFSFSCARQCTHKSVYKSALDNSKGESKLINKCVEKCDTRGIKDMILNNKECNKEHSNDAYCKPLIMAKISNESRQKIFHSDVKEVRKFNIKRLKDEIGQLGDRIGNSGTQIKEFAKGLPKRIPSKKPSETPSVIEAPESMDMSEDYEKPDGQSGNGEQKAEPETKSSEEIKSSRKAEAFIGSKYRTQKVTPEKEEEGERQESAQKTSEEAEQIKRMEEERYRAYLEDLMGEGATKPKQTGESPKVQRDRLLPLKRSSTPKKQPLSAEEKEKRDKELMAGLDLD